MPHWSVMIGATLCWRRESSDSRLSMIIACRLMSSIYLDRLQ